MAEENWDEDVVATGETEMVTTAEMPEIKLFGKWNCDEINVSDMSLQVYQEKPSSTFNAEVFPLVMIYP